MKRVIFSLRRRLATARRSSRPVAINLLALGTVLIAGPGAAQLPGPPAAVTMPGLRNVDHVGLTVPDLDQAVRFFVNLFGAKVLMRGGPWSDPKGGAFERALGVDRAASVNVALLRLGPTLSLELVAFTAPGQAMGMPRFSDPGASHLAFYVDDIDAATAYLKAHGVLVREGPNTNGPGPIEGVRYVYFSTPWGQALELEQRPATVPYEAMTGKAYGPAPAWNWRPEGETPGEVVVNNVVHALPGRAAIAQQRLAALAAQTRKEAGCFDYRWYRSEADPNEFHSFERFADAAAAAEHRRAAYSLALLAQERHDPSLAPMHASARIIPF